MKNVLIKLTMFSTVVLLCGCSSVMSHTGGKEGTWPGTRASAKMIADDDTNWGTKSLVVLDMPFTAVVDTLISFVRTVLFAPAWSKARRRRWPPTPSSRPLRCLLAN